MVARKGEGDVVNHPSRRRDGEARARRVGRGQADALGGQSLLLGAGGRAAENPPRTPRQTYL